MEAIKNELFLTKKEKIFIFLMIFLYALNFGGKGEFFPLFIMPILLTKITKIKLSTSFFVLLFLISTFSLSFGIISFVYGYTNLIGAIGKIVYPILFLILGYIIVDHKENNMKLLTYLMPFIIGLFLLSLLSVIKTLLLYGDFNNLLNDSGGRNVKNFWGGGLISATALTAYLSFSLSLISIIFFKNKQKLKNASIIFIFIISVYIINGISSRTGILIVFLSIAINLMIIQGINIKKLINSILMSILLLIIYYFYNENIFDFKNKINKNFLFERIKDTQISNDSRVISWEKVISNIPHSLSGGREVYLSNKYAHNLWLDVIYDAGLLPFILIFIFTILSIYQIFLYLMKNNTSYSKSIVLSMTISFLVIFMLEPVLQGITINFIFFTYLIGILQKLNQL